MPALLFVDDHPLYGAGVQAALARAMPQLDVTLAADAKAALAHLTAGSQIDLCLVDLRLPGQDGMALVETLAVGWPWIARGLLCSEPTTGLIARARAAGCVACLSKSRGVDDLADALRRLFAGELVFDALDRESGCLSEKRRQVLRLAAEGKTNKQIAFDLGISERTVKDHWSYIFAQLSVANRAEAVARAHRLDMI